jgi:hypothetical protein
MTRNLGLFFSFVPKSHFHLFPAFSTFSSTFSMASIAQRWLESCIGVNDDYTNDAVLIKLSDTYLKLLESHLPSVHGSTSESEDPLLVDDPLSSARNSSEGDVDDT